VKAQPSNYLLGTEDIIALMREGVSDNIITAIVNKSTSGLNPVPTPPNRSVPGSDKLKPSK
jgi:hypothetical protein